MKCQVLLFLPALLMMKVHFEVDANPGWFANSQGKCMITMLQESKALLP